MIDIVSASAGSGKTTRLAQELERAIASGQARPESVLATTFTTKAAAELSERVRTRLLEAGRVDDAQRLTAASIGTVNSVCGRLVTEHAFELGLPPSLRVLDPAYADEMLQRSLSEVIGDGEAEELSELAWHMKELDVGSSERLRRERPYWAPAEWRNVVRDVIDQARVNRIPANELEACARRSVDGFAELLGEPGDAARIDGALREALQAFERGAAGDPSKGTKKALEEVKQALRKVERLPWSDWAKLANLEATKRSEPLAAEVRAAAADLDRHPRLHAETRRCIELVFAIAARALRAYEEHKQARGCLDFVDQEVLALRLLQDPQVSLELDLVLVDEFQDTSPLQLAIFLELSRRARRSVWVGDPKQSIYAFRGTDPALMDAALEVVMADRPPETLPRSYRSRPGLVRLTSSLFAAAFSGALPRERVELAPAREEEPPGLGPFVERWVLEPDARKRSAEWAPLAAGVRALLEERPLVRDRDAARPLRPGDVAVLCYRNDACAGVAYALAQQGIRAVLAREGLLATAEGAAALAALRLFTDGWDSLAAAELARLTTYARDEEGFLARVLERPGRDAFADVPVVALVREVASASPTLGAVAALDAAVEAAELRELCLSWGDAPARLANLDALRAHAVQYEAWSRGQGAGCTPAGLVAWLRRLGQVGLDQQAAFADEDAVTVSTWHGAKGLEWPVTVLHELGKPPETSAMGVHVVSDRERVDLGDPLAGRWIRYWPHPFMASQTKTRFHRRLEEREEQRKALEKDRAQRLRLLYVGWTRARDRVVLATREGQIQQHMLALLAEGDAPLLSEPVDGEATWAGHTVDVRVRTLAALEPVLERRVPGEAVVPAGPRQHPPAWITPSAQAASGSAGEVIAIGARLPLNGDPDMAALGQAVHGLLAADRPELSREERTEIAAGLLRRWGVHDALRPEDLLEASARLRAWAEQVAPGATWHRELPLIHRLATGSIVRGSADLVLELPDRLVLIDHKTFPGRIDQAIERAAGYGSQLALYAAALEAALGKPVAESWVHLPVIGRVVRSGASALSGSAEHAGDEVGAEAKA